MQVHPFLRRHLVIAPLLIIALSASGARGLITARALRPIATSCSTIAQVRRQQKAGAFWGRPHSWLAGKRAATATRMTAGPGPGGAAAAVVARLGVTTTAFILRGGGGGIGAEHDVISAVLSELANIRTPAALLGGAALGTIFVGPNKTVNKRLHLLYTALSTTAFALQLVCVLCSTLTCTAVSSQGKAIATSAIGFLSENMQFEFYVIRASFIYGLFSFLGALIVRGWLTYSSDKDQGSARVIMAILAGSGFFLLNFLHHTHNTLTLCLGGMTKRLFWLGLRTMYPTWRRFFRHLSWILATWAAVKILKLGPNQGGDQDGIRSTSTTAVSTETPGP